MLLPYTRDLTALRREVDQFAVLLRSKQSHAEREFLGFFKTATHFAAAVGTVNPEINSPDCVAVERPIFNFRCDVAIGQSESRQFTLVELEDAATDSVFRRPQTPTRAYPSWSPRFESGFSQLVDWAWRIDQEVQPSVLLEEIFGTTEPEIHYLLVIGRDHHISAADRSRLKWRAKNNVILGHRTTVWTYDELLRFIARRVDAAEGDALSLRR